MRDNPEEGELDPAESARKHCKKNSPSILSCIVKRTKEGCDCSSKIGSGDSGRGRKGTVLLMETEGIW